MEFVIVLLLIGFVVLAAKVAFWVFVIKVGVDLFRTHQRAFELEMQRLQADLGQVRSGAMTVGPQTTQRLAVEFSRAQRELAQMDRLRQESAELKMSAMRGEAASLGIFI